jgi:hypothetical protein
MNFRPIADAMRMPILGYFLVIGAILFAAIVVVGSELESKPLPVSQTIGVPPPFKASVEPPADSMWVRMPELSIMPSERNRHGP